MVDQTYATGFIPLKEFDLKLDFSESLFLSQPPVLTSSLLQCDEAMNHQSLGGKIRQPLELNGGSVVFIYPENSVGGRGMSSDVVRILGCT